MNEGEIAVAARPCRHPARGRDRSSLERDLRLVAPDRRPLPRRHDLLRRLRSTLMRQRQGGGAAGHLRRLDQQPDAQRERHRRLPHLLQALAAAARRGRPAGDDRGACRRHRSTSIVSDHDPQDVETKRLPFAEAADGAIGLETLLSAALRLVHDGACRLARLIGALSTRPAEILGLPAGRLAAGAPADLVAVRSRRALCARQARSALALEELALRRSAAARAASRLTLAAGQYCV